MEIKKIELKKIKVFEEMSEETNCYTGTVYINGKPAIDVRNDGHGGCDMQYPINGNDRSIIEAANAYCRKNFPATVFLFGDKDKNNLKQKDILYCDLEIWCGDQIERNAQKKFAKKMTTGKVSFVQGDDILSISTKAHPEAQVVAFIRQKYGNVVILNELSPENQIDAILDKRKDRITLTPEEAAKIPA